MKAIRKTFFAAALAAAAALTASAQTQPAARRAGHPPVRAVNGKP